MFPSHPYNGVDMPKMMDISPLISPKIGVWTGDTEFSQQFLCRFETGANLDLSTITTTVHLGAHTDAPSHYVPNGQTMEERPLELYYGPCQIITVDVPRGERILPKHIEGIEIVAERVLFHTKSFPNPNHFSTDFNALSPELVDHCAERGVRLIGLDTPSVDPYSSKALESHNAIARHDMAVLEGVVLTDVADGVYTLIALPLKIQGSDASPVRAVLVG